MAVLISEEPVCECDHLESDHEMIVMGRGKCTRLACECKLFVEKH